MSLLVFHGDAQASGARDIRIVGEENLSCVGDLFLTRAIIFPLPFRLRTGTEAVFTVGPKPATTIILRNDDVPALAFPQRLTQRDIPATTAVVVLSAKPVDADLRNHVSCALDAKDPTGAARTKQLTECGIFLDFDAILRPFNRLITRYRAKFSREIQFNRIRRILARDFLGRAECEFYGFHTLQTGPSDFVSTVKVFDEILKLQSRCPIGGNQSDLPTSGLEEIKKQLEGGIEYSFYTLAFQAHDFVAATDLQNALLYAVFAFESAHAEFVERFIQSRAPAARARRLAEDFLREVGISAFAGLTPYIFMEPAQRPSEEVIERTGKAIRVRNELAHAKRDRANQPKVESHSSKELRELVFATLQ